MKMEKEEIAKRLKEAWEKDEDVTIVVRTGVHETQEVPLVRTQASNWEVLKERGKERECEVVVKTFEGIDTKGNETVIVEMYRMENIEGFSLELRAES